MRSSPLLHEFDVRRVVSAVPDVLRERLLDRNETSHGVPVRPLPGVVRQPGEQPHPTFVKGLEEA